MAFYCLNEDGTKENTPAVYYFDHFEIDGTVFDGYYYHDESGKFTAGNSHMVPDHRSEGSGKRRQR